MAPDIVLVAIGSTAFVIGALIGWIIARRAGRHDLADAAHIHQGAVSAQQTLFAETAKRLGETQEELHDLRQTFDDARETSAALREENAKLRTELAHHQQTMPEKMALLEKAQEQLRTSFDALAAPRCARPPRSSSSSPTRSSATCRRTRSARSASVSRRSTS